MVRLMKSEKGFSLIEVMIAIALLGIIGTAFLGALSTASKAMFIADERATAESLARSQMEDVKSREYEAYVPPPPPLSYTKDGDESATHPGYFIWIDAFPIDPDTGELLINPDTGDFLINPDTGDPYDDEGIQKITITIKHYDKPIITSGNYTLEGYKVDR